MKSSAFYRSWRFIAMLTTARHLALPKINTFHILPSHVFKIHLIITAINGLAFQVTSTFSFKYQNRVRFLIPPRAPTPTPTNVSSFLIFIIYVKPKANNRLHGVTIFLFPILKEICRRPNESCTFDDKMSSSTRLWVSVASVTHALQICMSDVVLSPHEGGVTLRGMTFIPNTATSRLTPL